MGGVRGPPPHGTGTTMSGQDEAPRGADWPFSPPTATGEGSPRAEQLSTCVFLTSLNPRDVLLGGQPAGLSHRR